MGWIPVALAMMLFACGNDGRERVMATYDNGQPSVVRYFDHDGQCVREVQYYEDGIVKMEGGIKDNLRDGEWKAYFPDGRLQSEGLFSNNLRTGKAVVYYENGNRYMEGYYKEGRHCGHWIYYDEQGYVLREVDYGD